MESKSESQFARIAQSVGSTQLGAVLAEWSVEDRVRAGEALEGLEEHPGYQAIVRLLKESYELALVQLIHAPHATDNAAALQKQLGIVKGLGFLDSAIPTIREAAESARAERDAAAEAADAERQGL